MRGLLAGSLDYAGMFPPAGLPLSQAVDDHRRNRRRPMSWMLGRLVVPANQLVDLARIYDRKRDGQLTVIVPSHDDGTEFLREVDQTLRLLEKFPATEAIDMLEFRWSTSPRRDSDGSPLGKLVQTVAGHILGSRMPTLTMFFELPRRDRSPTPNTEHELIRTAVAALAAYNQAAKSLNCRAGFKLRCGGSDAAAIPASREVAAVICECRDHQVFWKATAGLHHPFRPRNPTQQIPTHGFLNLLVAAVLADVHRLDERQTQAVIDEGDRHQFSFSDEALIWREYSVAAEQIPAARDRSLHSFGSCSFVEPCQDLTSLGLL
jgi:hypothetical protein